MKAFLARLLGRRPGASSPADYPLAREETMFRDLVDKSLVGVYLIQDGLFVYVNPRLAEIFGYQQSEINGRLGVGDLVADDDREKVVDNVRRRISGDMESIHYTFHAQRKDKSVITVEVRGARTRFRGRPAVIGTLLDVTVQHEVAEALQLSADALANTAEAVLILDSERGMLNVNKAFTTITGYEAQEVMGQTPDFLRPPGHRSEYYDRIWQSVRRDGHWQGEVWFERKNKELFPALVGVSTVSAGGKGQTRYVVVVSDITQFKQYEERLEFLAHYDPLTDLPNRALFQERLEAAVSSARRRGRQCALLFIDVDYFKHVNDSLGHALGDELLQSVARRLTQTFEASHTVARLGGDEFAVLLDDIAGPAAAAQEAQRVLGALSDPIEVGDQQLYTTASIGISCFPQDGTSPHGLLRDADTAMYKAKDLGRNTFQFFSSELNTRAVESLTIVTRLRKAWETRQLNVYYQPIIDLRSGRIIALEALLRWFDPELGEISPTRFIPVAEQTGLILGLGAWALETACHQAMAWEHEGLPPVTMAVNVSLRQLRQRDFVGQVKRVLDDTGLPPERLKLEITESSVMDNPARAESIFRQIAGMGVKLAIDDFGVGHSSLSYLKRLPIDYLKIDRSFVSDLPEDQNDVAITRAIIALAQNMDLRMVAEGIENSEQQRFLQQAGVQEGQGYLYSKPVDAQATRGLLDAGTISTAAAL